MLQFSDKIDSQRILACFTHRVLQTDASKLVSTASISSILSNPYLMRYFFNRGNAGLNIEQVGTKLAAGGIYLLTFF